MRAMTADELRAKGAAVVRLAGKQIALFDTPEGPRACNNRCPHEGYPLSEGSLDGGILTCNWHNWKFALASGDNLLGGDRLRVYPAELRAGAVWVDVADPPADARRAAALAQLAEAIDEDDYTRIARELARLASAGGRLEDALAAAILRSHDRLEFGWTHAYAGAADWLRLADGCADEETRLICFAEALGHIADDTLREPLYPYPPAERTYVEVAFVAAVEAEDEAAVTAFLRGALAAGHGFAGLERGLARAALAHYNDFGHSLIYLVKLGRLVDRMGPAVAPPLLLAYGRSLLNATREDKIPEFRAYAGALRAWGTGGAGAVSAAAYRGLNVAKALALTVEHSRAPAPDLYRALVGANAWNLLAFDLSFHLSNDGPVSDNVGWLDFTHAITFANAVRLVCGKFPELWPAGLLQLACFSGRNAPYTDLAQDLARWRVSEPDAFFRRVIETLLDHGCNEYIVSVHLLKTALATREEVDTAPAPERETLLAALNRFLNSPLRRKAVRRSVRQAMAFVALEG